MKINLTEALNISYQDFLLHLFSSHGAVVISFLDQRDGDCEVVHLDTRDGPDGTHQLLHTETHMHAPGTFTCAIHIACILCLEKKTNECANPNTSK